MFHSCASRDAGVGAQNLTMLHFRLADEASVVTRTRPGDLWTVVGAVGGVSGLLLTVLKLLRLPCLPPPSVPAHDGQKEMAAAGVELAKV